MNGKARVTPDQEARVWFVKQFHSRGDEWESVFVQSSTLDDQGKVMDCHGCGVTISVVTYDLTRDSASIKQHGITKDVGSWGSAPDVAEPSAVSSLILSGDSFALLVSDGSTNQGETDSGRHVFAFAEGRWSYLGYIATGSENGGECGSDSGMSCFHYDGSISVVANSGSDYPNLFVSRTGTTLDADGKVVPATNSTYVFNGTQYIDESSHADNTSDQAQEMSRCLAVEKLGPMLRPKDVKAECQQALVMGPEYARTSGTTWTISRSQNEMTDRDELKVESIQKNNSGAVAVVQGQCHVKSVPVFGFNSIFITALIADEQGNATVDVPRTFQGIRGALRINGAQPFDGFLKPTDFSNKVVIADLAIENGSIITTADNVITWRVMAKFDTSRGPMLIKIPVFDDNVQRLIQWCDSLH